MKKIIFSLATLGLVLVACKKEASPASDAVKTDSAVVSSDSLADPDTTDTIAAANYTAAATNTQTAEKVRKFLQTEFKKDVDSKALQDNDKKFIQFEFDINDDGKKEIFVGLNGPYFCGTGGCTQYILNEDGTKLANFTVSDYPVVIDNTKTNGYKDLFIMSGGKYRIVKFDGKTYPSNPSTLPELKVVPGDGLPRALNYLNEPYPWFKF
ncbi:hypothetical protein GCM10010992_05340 [Cloacibacterium rupense]|uniref:Lipoprotein n=1 Tax=Cloacibacterium rupense TaxID=517423 RepID=A0ABQ2NFM0_9FLAO|nr:hypothetical protein [Cloacibacterium rupense]GGP02142.1 hypothetical protein GCM10010992_05340 [Cloacibacterium rupense]